MSEQSYDFRIIFTKIEEMEDLHSTILGETILDDIEELDEIRTLRMIVTELNSTPLVYFAST